MRAAFQPHIPCTPPPGRVDDEHRKTRGSGVAHGVRESTGRAASWRQSDEPPSMDPPTSLGLCASSATGPMTCRASTRSRNPGANRSTCASIAPVMSPG